MIFNIYNEKYNISLLSVKVSSSVHQNAFFFSPLLFSEKNEEKAQSPFSDDDRANRATRDQKVRTEQQRGWMFRV
tara:strand:- start:197 stop:421 length:225 start_codon:yes stop_codon:yes gene_type:complete